MTLAAPKLRVAAVVGVKDEAELLDACVKHLFAIGVDFVAIADDNSTDGSRQIAERLVELYPSRVMVVALDPTLTANLALDGPLFGALLERINPDWIFICDADEFYLPKTGSIKDLEDTGALDLLAIPRFNYAFPGPEAVKRLDFTTEVLMDLPLIQGAGKFSDAEFIRHDAEERWIFRAIKPKVVVRPQAVREFTLGAHRAEAKGSKRLRRGIAKDVVIVHLPFTSYQRFCGKVENVRAFIGRFCTEFEQQAWHWRRWMRLAEEGALEAEFARQIVDPQELAELKAAGQVRTAREIFALAQSGPVEQV